MRLLPRWRRIGIRSLDDFVKLTAVEPDTSALGAIVDLDPLSLRHHQLRTIYWTVHADTIWEVDGYTRIRGRYRMSGST
jgi:hypothetical protein